MLGGFAATAHAQVTFINSTSDKTNGATSLTVTVPGGTVSGDVILAVIAVRGTPKRTITAPSVTLPNTGVWTLLPNTSQFESIKGLTMEVWYKVASANEPVSYTWSWGSSNNAIVIQTSYRNVVPSYIDGSSGNTIAATTAPLTDIVATAITTTTSNTVLVGYFTNTSTAVVNIPVSMTSRDVQQSGGGGAGIRTVVADEPFTGPGATGDRLGSGGNGEGRIGHLIALRSIPSGGANPGSFNAFETSTAAAVIVGNIRTKVAGAAFSLDVVAIQSGVQLSSFNNSVIVELLGNAALGVPLDAQNCPTSFTLLQTVSPNPTITNGRSTVNFAAVPNSWRDVRVRIRWPTASPTVSSCSTDNFAIRPASLAVAVTDANWSTAGTTRALANTGAVGGNVHKAGQPFTLTVTPSPGTATNYDGSPTVSALACTLPATCASGTLTVGAFAGSGTRTSTTASYSEAGAFNLTLVDLNYASVDAADGTPADCSGRYVCQSPAPVAVGRFVPNHFAVAAVTQPVFRTFDAIDAACTVPPSGAVRSFTYIGQFFGYQTQPAALVIAQNASNGITTNYRGTLWKLTAASVTQSLANSPVLALDISQVGAAVLSEVANTGTGTLTSNAADKIAFVRNAATPQAAFTANLTQTWSVADANESGANQGVITTTTPLAFNGGGSGIAFDGGGAAAGMEFRYGRLTVFNASGSQLIALPIRIFAQYWNGTSFIVNTADHCTTLSGTHIEMSSFQNTLGPIAACRTRLPASITFNAGRARAPLTAPGANVMGSVNLTVHLEPTVIGTPQTCTGVTPSAVTGANRTYLQGNWSGGAYNQNPLGIGIFGIYQGSAEIIHLRENY